MLTPHVHERFFDSTATPAERVNAALVLARYADAPLFTELFPGRTEVPKTLIFAKDDHHAEEITGIVREVFGKGNDFAKKITYKTDGGDPETSDHWLQHFKATLQLTVGGQSLTAALDGQFNFTTRQTVVNGVVLEGWLSGAQIHEEGQVVGFSPLTFVGTVMVMRGSAN